MMFAKDDKDPCHVADQFCIAPANQEGAFARNVCYHCGEPVCSKCSSKRKYQKFKSVRLCNDCQCELDDPVKRTNSFFVTRRMHRMAGYPQYDKKSWLRQRDGYIN